MARAELLAAVIVMEKAVGRVVFVSDCRMVVDGIRSPATAEEWPAWAEMSVMADLWSRASGAPGRATVDCRWMPSHLQEEEAVGAGWPKPWWEGNAEADACAKRGRRDWDRCRTMSRRWRGVLGKPPLP